MPVVLDADAAAVFEAFKAANRPPYETLSAPEARQLYLDARFATNPDAPELAAVTPLDIPAPHGSDSGAPLHTEDAAAIERAGAGAGIPPWRRLCHRRSRFPRRRLPQARRRGRADRDIGRLPPGARTQIPRGRRRFHRRHAMGGGQRQSAQDRRHKNLLSAATAPAVICPQW